MRISTYLLFVLVLLSTTVFGQQISVLRGKVVDEDKQPIIGANIVLEGTYDGTSSDLDGKFEFQTESTDSAVITFTYLGKEAISRGILLKGDTLNFSIKLEEAREMLTEVVISAGSFEAVTDKKRAAVLNPLDIVLTASASADIAGAINTLLGTTRNGESGQLLVRGGAAYETKTFIDGILVQKPYNSTIGNLPARNRFSPFLFKGTSFSTGGYSAEYGQAMSSALMLQTEDLAEKTVTGVQLLSVGAGVSHTQRWKNTSLTAGLDHTNLKPYFAFIPQKVKFDKAPQTWEGNIVFRHKLNEKGSMIKLYSYTNTSDMLMQSDFVFNGLSDGTIGLRADNHFTNLTLQHGLPNDWTLYAALGINYNKDKMQHNQSKTTTLSAGQARATFSKPLSTFLNIKTGLDLQRIQYKEAYFDGQQGFTLPATENMMAAFGESEFVIARKFSGRVGLRGEYSQLLQKMNFAPRATFAYTISKGEQVSLAAGSFYQNPEFQHLVNNSTLNQESANHLIFNYQKIKNGLIFRVEAYKKWYNGLVKTPDFTSEINNNGSGYAQGVDVFFRDNKSIKNGDYWVSYSYLDTKRDWRNFPIAARPDFAMKHSLSLVGKKFFPDLNIALSGSYSYNSGRPYYNPTASEAGFTQDRTPAYHDVSATMTYLTNIKGNFTVVYLSVQNLLGTKQIYSYRYNQDAVSGAYQRFELGPPAKRFAVLAVVMTIGEQYKKTEVTSDDY
ncbi:MAG TPA: TonB-dependent receptor [Saprospiraceae bacterium]|nr:TonB-dependent receptor [Saprospiraceae bacterium]